MTILVIFSLFSSIIFGIVAVVIFFKQRESRYQLSLRDNLQKHKVYELTILKEIQDRIGYSLDIEKVVDVITGNLKYLFSFSSTACLVKRDGKLIFKMHVEEPVSHVYYSQVKKKMLESLSALEEINEIPYIDEFLTGVALDDATNTRLISYFNIPLIVNNTVVGLINVSSARESVYKESEVQVVYQIANQTSSALSKLQEVLHTEKSKLTALLASLTDGVFMIDTSEQVLVINETAKSFLHLNASNNITLKDIASAFGGVYDLLDHVKEAIDKKTVLQGQEVMLNNKIMELSITPVFAPSSTGVFFTDHEERHGVIGASILMHDITLEKTLGKMKEEFTNIMVHELRAPLTAIKDAAQLMQTTPSLTDSDKSQMLDIIKDQSTILLSNVTTLLDAAKVEAGKLSVDKAPVDIKHLIEEEMQIFLPQARQKNIRLVADLAPDLPKIDADQMRISQVMNNLISNGLKFTNPGGEVKIRTSVKTAIYSEKRAMESMIFVEIQDNGIGIPFEKQDDLFTRFTQVMQKNQQGKQPLGSGLGLYIAKGIVKAHGGNISLESEPNKGTTITFCLPVAQEKQEYEESKQLHIPANPTSFFSPFPHHLKKSSSVN